MKSTGKLRVIGADLRDTQSYCVARAEYNGSMRGPKAPSIEELVRVRDDNARRLCACWNALRNWPLEEIERVSDKGIKLLPAPADEKVVAISGGK